MNLGKGCVKLISLGLRRAKIHVRRANMGDGPQGSTTVGGWAKGEKFAREERAGRTR